MDRSEATQASWRQAADGPTGAGYSGWASDASMGAERPDGISPPGVALELAPGSVHLTADGESRDEEQRELRNSSSESGGDDSETGAEHGNDLGEALRLAERLTGALRALEERERSAYRLDQETMERIRRLEQSAQTIAAVHHALQEQVRVELADEELGVVESLLTAWVDRPNDLLVMVKLSERSTVLAGIVAAFREIRRLLESAGETPGTSE